MFDCGFYGARTEPDMSEMEWLGRWIDGCGIGGAFLQLDG